MLHKILFLISTPLIITSMQKPAAQRKVLLEEKKFNFMCAKINEMAQQVNMMRYAPLFCSTKAEYESAQLKATLTGETISEHVYMLLTIHPLPLITQLKQNALTRTRLIQILHHTDPPSNNKQARFHEEFLHALCQEVNIKPILQWATEYDAEQIAKGHSQRYGTCIDENYTIKTPVAACNQVLQNTDMDKINARRAAIGLPSFQEQLVDAFSKESANRRKDC